jgi:hypothetical protein
LQQFGYGQTCDAAADDGKIQSALTRVHRTVLSSGDVSWRGVADPKPCLSTMKETIVHTTKGIA